MWKSLKNDLTRKRGECDKALLKLKSNQINKQQFIKTIMYVLLIDIS